ncbi:LPXTG-domain-containing protein [Apiospora kogelbergensis]|uniref:LPXTG-domain-containing protein n=1 Tax=Apiospora kogelbergensis TaxID=1337665 RepID=A0AAW0QF69_9PEZI
MASLSSILAVLFLFLHFSSPLQVTPNSPCASVCVDSNDLDHSDPNSSNTSNKDISCHDTDYANTAAGQKFRRCLSCLQDSTFSQGSESDQGWFLYNLRYTFDHCIFGFPNATEVESTPCSTSTACGALENALTGDKLNARSLEPYGFCAADGGAMVNTNIPIQKCISCVSASQGQKYLANYMVALQAGCTQQPAPGTAVGLNGTVFSSTIIGMVDPTSASSSSRDEKPALATPALVGIAIGGAVLLLGITGLIFVRQRTRRNRRQRLAASLNGDAPNSRRKQGHRPASSLSFRCQTHLSPRSPNFFHHLADSVTQEEKHQTPYMNSAAAAPLGSNPVNSASSNSSGERSYGRGGPNHLQNITTSAPTVPDHVHYSTSPKAKGFSPVDTATPASAVSTKSTAQLLPTISYTYNPADYGVARPQVGGIAHNNNNNNSYASPTSASTASPLLSRAWEQQSQRSWDPLPPRPSVGAVGANHRRLPAVKVSVGGGNAAGGNKGKRGSNTGSPVESEEIKVIFAGPPR